MNNKPFLLFGGDTYYPSGGWHDFIGAFSTFEEAYNFTSHCLIDWAHIVETTTGRVVNVTPKISEEE